MFDSVFVFVQVFGALYYYIMRLQLLKVTWILIPEFGIVNSVPVHNVCNCGMQLIDGCSACSDTLI